MENNLAEDKYNTKNAEFVGRMVFILLLIFNILISFQVMGYDAGIII